MKVFISWNGTASNKAACVLRKYITKIVQNAEPFVSNLDISKGSQGVQKILTELSETNFGILCFTPSNTKSLWMMFESGAIFKTVDKARLVPVLFSMGLEDLDGTPIRSIGFQATFFKKADFKELFLSINRSMDSPNDEEHVETLFEVHWQAMENEFEEINFIAKDNPIVKELSALPGIASAKPLNGLWISRFTYKKYRKSEYWDGVQFGLEVLQETEQEDALVGRNLLIQCTGSPYFHKTQAVIHGRFVVGYWTNLNTTNVGCFQLSISSNYEILEGMHLGNANDNTIQNGEWEWIRVNCDTELTPDYLDKLQTQFSLIDFDALEEKFSAASQDMISLNFEDIITDFS